MKHSFLAMTLAAVAIGVSSTFVACPTASASISSEVVKTGSQDSLYPVVHLKDDAAVEAKINADIRNQIEDMKNALNYPYDELQVSYKLKSVIQKSLDETQILFQSLMQEYFG